ncbi:MAG: hypothetical protein NWE98_11615 [Candidatus Bathyarchaeota archaeon]|nr:hypothetical protein [Candidatus Bathyarchaeota archaeon]
MDKKKLLGLILALLVLSASASTVRAVEVVKTVPFGSLLMVYDSYKGAIWGNPEYLSGYWGVMNNLPSYSPTNTVVAISDNDSSVLANITVGGTPTAIVYDSALHEVYVTDKHTIWVISDDSNSVVATIKPNTTLCGNPSSMVYDSGKEEIFAITYNYTPGYTNRTYGVTVISCNTKQVVASIPLGNYPEVQDLTGLVYDSANGEIYVSCWNYNQKEYENYIFVISDSNNSIVATIPLGNSTFVGPGAYDSATGEIYLPTNNRTVLVISDKTHTITDSIHYANSPDFREFISIAYDPVKSVLFIGTLDKTYIISDRTKSVIETIPMYAQSIVYDSGQNAMLLLNNAVPNSIKFISDASLPDPPPTPTPTPTPSPSGNQNPVFLGLGWLQFAILVVMGIIAVAVGVAAFRFLSKRRGAEQTEQE